jgi:ABC-type transport system involved in multi-copper enzyme maturation permease subunit
MLWYKSWLETRWRFAIGLAILILSATGTVLAYPRVLTLLPLMPAVDTSNEVGRRIKEIGDLSRTYGGYIWAQWLHQNMTQMLSLFAALLGTGGLLSQASGGGALFTLSLPVSRDRLLGARVATGLTELLVLAFIPSLALPLLSPAVGGTYAIGDALVHGACAFVAATVIFSAASLLSTVFTDVWRPALIVCGAAAVLGVIEPFFGQRSRYSLFGIMAGEMYFRGDGLPWLGLLASAVVSAAMLFAASRNLARQDF